MKRLLSLALRLGGIGGKFVAMLALARFSGAVEVGRFALFFAAINILVFAIGLEFHLFSVREILLRRSVSGRLRMISGQLALDLTIYMFVILAGGIVYLSPLANVSPVPIAWFVGILILDHFNQEISRLFLILRKPNASNLIFAIKSGLWGWIASAAIFFKIMPPKVEYVYFIWLLCGLIGISIGIIISSNIFKGKRIAFPKYFWRWILHGISVSKYYYITSICLISISSLDRFVVANGSGIESAGQYAFWHGISSLIPITVYSLTGMHYLPILVESYQRRQMEEFRAHCFSFAKQTLLIASLCGAILAAFSAVIPAILGRPEFNVSRLLVILLALSYGVNAAWQVPYQVLYSAGKDRVLAVILIAISVVIVPLTYFAVLEYGLEGAGAINLLGSLAILIGLSVAAIRESGLLVRPTFAWRQAFKFIFPGD